MADKEGAGEASPSSKRGKEDDAASDDGDDEEYEYCLVGVVDHMGSADAGHYLSYISVDRDKEFRNKA